MSRIKIKNFGPIREGYQENDGWMEIKKVTIFVGNQGSGKSTVAKTISTMMWIEKALNRGDFEMPQNRNGVQTFFEYQNLDSYFRDKDDRDAAIDTLIEYEGDAYKIADRNNRDGRFLTTRNENQENYVVPKIMYVPAERNFLSVIENATGVRGLPAPLFEFAEELKRGQRETKGLEIELPITGIRYQYDASKDASFIVGDDFKVNLAAASSGFQALVPLFVVSQYLAKLIHNGVELNPDNISVDQSLRMNAEIGKIMTNRRLSDTDKIAHVNSVKARFLNSALVNIVEEPEQNLFPSSQKQVLESLLAFNNMNEGNKLIMTTHSPYLVNYLTLAVKAGMLKKKIKDDATLDKIGNIVRLDATIAPEDLAIYELDETTGTIRSLPRYEGIPSDRNYLNEKLGEANELYDALLEIEEEYES